MLITTLKVVKAFVLAYVATDIILDAAKSIYEWNSGRKAENQWNEYLDAVYPHPPVDKIATDIYN